MSYYVPEGNWTNNVTNSLGNGKTIQFNYGPGVDSVRDPAYGCAKTFTAKYKCGNGTTEKTLSLSAEAGGQIAKFDCTAEDTQCQNLKLTLADNGQLTLTTLDGKTTVWDSVKNGSFTALDPATIVPAAAVLTNPPSNKPLTITDYAGDGKPNPKYDVSAGSGPGRRSPYNYLLPGEFLELGQWIGSPTGTCRLIMGTEEAPNSLQVVTTILGCNTLDAAGPPIDPVSSRLYTIPDMYNSSKGKVGYVDNEGQLNVYPDAMTKYSNTFENIGNYSLPAGASLGPATAAADVAACEKLCTSKGDTQKCAGFVFDSTTAMCQLLNNSLYKQNRIIDPTNSTYQYYARTKLAAGQDTSCPTESNLQNTLFWNATPASTSNPEMKPTTTCGLANYTQKERAKVAGALPAITNDTGFAGMFGALQQSYAQLKASLFSTTTQIDADMSELKDARQNLADWTGEKQQNLDAMNEDRDLNMLSQNYRHILWSILAIVIVIATLKIAKSIVSGLVSSGSASDLASSFSASASGLSSSVSNSTSGLASSFSAT
jgi:hypothetical protein